MRIVDPSSVVQKVRSRNFFQALTDIVDFRPSRLLWRHTLTVFDCQAVVDLLRDAEKRLAIRRIWKKEAEAGVAPCNVPRN